MMDYKSWAIAMSNKIRSIAFPLVGFCLLKVVPRGFISGYKTDGRNRDSRSGNVASFVSGASVVK